MKEDLSLYGNELNYANAIWSAAYVFGQIPSNLILTRVSFLFLSAGRKLTDIRSTPLYISPFLNLDGPFSPLQLPAPRT